MAADNFVLEWMCEVGLDLDWTKYAHPDWLRRSSLFETQLESALELSYNVAFRKKRRNESMHRIVTRAIAQMVPVSQVSNAELLQILFGLTEQSGSLRAEKRTARNFRNEKRPLKLDTAVRYILDLLYGRKIEPAEAGRLWYMALLYAGAIAVINDHLKQGSFISPALLPRNKVAMISKAHKKFAVLWETSLRKSCALSVAQPRSEYRRFLDYCAFVQWQESRIKRNPIVGIERMIALAPGYNEFEFDS